MTRQLRTGNGQNGLILANGGVMTYQHVVCLSSRPRTDGSTYPTKSLLPYELKDRPVPPISLHPEGEAVIEVNSAFLLLSHGLTLIIDLYRWIQSRWQSSTRVCHRTTSLFRWKVSCQRRWYLYTQPAMQRVCRTNWSKWICKRRSR